jgi:hypothetical protein
MLANRRLPNGAGVCGVGGDRQILSPARLGVSAPAWLKRSGYVNS